MKFSKLGQLALASSGSAALVLGITACGQSNTIDFIYVASANASPGSIYAYAADGESGALREILGSPFSALGRNPVAMVASPSGKDLYVVNHDDNSVVQFAVGTDGKIYPQNQVNLKLGSGATNLAISPDGKYLYVVEAYGLDAKADAYTPTAPGIGALIQLPIAADGTITPDNPGTAYPTCNNPVAVNVLGDGSTVYVVNDPAGQLTTLIDTVGTNNFGATGSTTVTYPAVGNCSGGTGAQGQITSYTVGSNGVLTAGAGSPFNAGVAPVGIASDPTSRFLYAIDYRSNALYSYQVLANGNLQALTSSSSVTTGQLPSAITIDPRGKYIYVSNYRSGSVSGFALNTSTGAPSSLATSGSAAVNPGPAAIIAEPSIGRYVYTANFIDNSVSGLYYDPNSGVINQVQNSPFPGIAKATAVAAIKHGDHSVQLNATY